MWCDVYMYICIQITRTAQLSIDVWNIHDIVAHVFPYYIVCGTHTHIYTHTDINMSMSETRALWMKSLCVCVRVHFRCVCIAHTMPYARYISYGGQSVGFCREACKRHRRYRPRWCVYAYTHDMTLSNTETEERREKKIYIHKRYKYILPTWKYIFFVFISCVWPITVLNTSEHETPHV